MLVVFGADCAYAFHSSIFYKGKESQALHLFCVNDNDTFGSPLLLRFSSEEGTLGGNPNTELYETIASSSNVQLYTAGKYLLLNCDMQFLSKYFYKSTVDVYIIYICLSKSGQNLPSNVWMHCNFLAINTIYTCMMPAGL